MVEFRQVLSSGEPVNREPVIEDTDEEPIPEWCWSPLVALLGEADLLELEVTAEEAEFLVPQVLFAAPRTDSSEMVQARFLNRLAEFRGT